MIKMIKRIDILKQEIASINALRTATKSRIHEDKLAALVNEYIKLKKEGEHNE